MSFTFKLSNVGISSRDLIAILKLSNSAGKELSSMIDNRSFGISIPTLSCSVFCVNSLRLRHRNCRRFFHSQQLLVQSRFSYWDSNIASSLSQVSFDYGPFYMIELAVCDTLRLINANAFESLFTYSCAFCSDFTSLTSTYGHKS